MATAPPDVLTTVSFRVKYWTTWGQNLVVVGSHAQLGEWDVRKGIWMHCEHVGSDELLWTAKATGSFHSHFEYRYAVVDGDMNVVRWDAFSRGASFTPRAIFTESESPLPDSGKKKQKQKPNRDRVEIRDTWESTTHPENVFRRKTFRDVVVPDDTAQSAGDSGRRRETLVGGALGQMNVSMNASTNASMNVPMNLSEDSASPVFHAPPTEIAGNDFVTGTTRVRLEVRTLRPTPGLRLHAVGSSQSLGQWDRDASPAMLLDTESRTWRLDVDVHSDEFPVRYKYYLKCETKALGKSGAHSSLESGANRVIVPLGWSESADGDASGDGARNESEKESASKSHPEAAHSIPGFPSPLGAPTPAASGYGLLNENPGDTRDVPFSWHEQPLANEQPLAPGRESGRRESSRNAPGSGSVSGDIPSSPPVSEPSPSNRWVGPDSRPSRIIARDGHFRFPSPWRGCGIAVPVFSLRSTHSVGSGDFGDLATLVDVAHLAGMNVVQILPVNDTTVHGTWEDSYPYSSMSVFALHPLYLKLSPLLEEAALVAGPGRAHVFAALRLELEKARHALDLKEVDYEATIAVKMSIAKRCLKETAVRTTFLESKAFKTFLQEQQGWLKPYAVFSALRELFGTAEHWRWGALGAENAFETVARLSAPPNGCDSGAGSIHDAVVLRYYVQFHLDSQLRAASAFAKKKGVLLKGDLPIGVDKASVDTWMHPTLFRMHASTGAPPDQFDPNGQNWGFPTYNWDAMSKDGYEWWRERMRHLERYFSAMRVDHVLGFFRIWELPGHARLGKMGRFRPSVPIRRHELDKNGLWFVDRLCDPWITGVALRSVFGDRDGEASGRFLEETGIVVPSKKDPGTSTMTFRFKTEFRTEEGLLDGDAFRIRDGSPDWLIKETAELRAGLLKLQHNVCLLRDAEDADAFYPRIELGTTSSFQELEPWAQNALLYLSDDYFNKRQDTLWRENARRTLPALTECTGQLVCGEDLGMVPQCVQPVLEDLGILGLRIQRMPHSPGLDGEFGAPSTYAYDTVCSPSCHDTNTTRAWYEADEARRCRFAASALEMRGGVFPSPPAYRAEHVEPGSSSNAFAPPKDGVHVQRQGDAQGRRRGSIDDASARRPSVDCGGHETGRRESVNYDETADPEKEPPGVPPAKCEPRVMRAIIRQHMASPSALAIFPMQDLLALNNLYAQRPASEETINDPTNNKHYWRFRLHLRLEDLLSNHEWLADIKQLVDEAGRNPSEFFAHAGGH